MFDPFHVSVHGCPFSCALRVVLCGVRATEANHILVAISNVDARQANQYESAYVQLLQVPEGMLLGCVHKDGFHEVRHHGGGLWPAP